MTNLHLYRSDVKEKSEKSHEVEVKLIQVISHIFCFVLSFHNLVLTLEVGGLYNMMLILGHSVCFLLSWQCRKMIVIQNTVSISTKLPYYQQGIL